MGQSLQVIFKEPVSDSKGLWSFYRMSNYCLLLSNPLGSRHKHPHADLYFGNPVTAFIWCSFTPRWQQLPTGNVCRWILLRGICFRVGQPIYVLETLTTKPAFEVTEQPDDSSAISLTLRSHLARWYIFPLSTNDKLPCVPLLVPRELDVSSTLPKIGIFLLNSLKEWQWYIQNKERMNKWICRYVIFPPWSRNSSCSLRSWMG